MFSTFTKEEGQSLIIRTEDLKRIEDTSNGCVVFWEENNITHQRRVHGTAAENYARLQSEELRLIEAAAERQRRYDGGLPLMPVPRGRVGR
jgi:hypothetical protein